MSRFSAERFGDAIGVTVNDKMPEKLMSPAQARTLAIRLLNCAESVENAPVVRFPVIPQVPERRAIHNQLVDAPDTGPSPMYRERN